MRTMLSRRAFPRAGRREPRVVARRGSGVETRETGNSDRRSMLALGWTGLR